MLVAVSLWTAVAPIGGCAFDTVRRLDPPERVLAVPRKTPFLKVHLRDGRLAILADWTVAGPHGSVSRRTSRPPAAMRSIGTRLEPSETRLSGYGWLYGAARDEIGRGDMAFAMDSVVLLESNRDVTRMHPAIAALLIVVGVTVATIAIACSIDPKSCFGSCPTFYVDDGRDPLLQAEGFSSSVAPALERTDVDALYRARIEGRDVHVGMRNEAMETHVVRFVRLLAAPRRRGERVFATGNGVLWRARDLRTPVTAEAAEGNVEPALRAFDGAERFGVADSNDLGARETIELTFADAGAGERGVVIASRQTLLTTFLFYQTLAQMGRATGSWIAEMERRGAAGSPQEFPVGAPAGRHRRPGPGRAWALGHRGAGGGDRPARHGRPAGAAAGRRLGAARATEHDARHVASRPGRAREPDRPGSPTATGTRWR